MSADNWTICPNCIKICKQMKDEFVSKYVGKLDDFVFMKIEQEMIKMVEYMESYSSDEYKPNKEILELMEKRDIEVTINGSTCFPSEMLQQGQVSICLREDYEKGVNDADGNVYFNYSCSCNCGFGKNIIFDESKQKIVDKEVKK